MYFKRNCYKLFVVLFALSFSLLLSSFASLAVSPAHAATNNDISHSQTNQIAPHVPGCWPWVVSEKTSGPLVVDLEEDNCYGYYTVAYFSGYVANFHVYTSAAMSVDGYCTASLGYTSCETAYAGFSGNSKHQVCFYGEAGLTMYTNKAYGCINV
jgi:hypothetical protein